MTPSPAAPQRPAWAADSSARQPDADLTLSHYRIFAMLASHGPQRTIDLAERLGVQPSTAANACGRLADKGLVQRCQRTQGDRRVAWVMLSQAGKSIAGEATRHHRAELERLTSPPERDRAAPVTAGLAAIINAADKADAQWPRTQSAATRIDGEP